MTHCAVGHRRSKIHSDRLVTKVKSNRECAISPRSAGSKLVFDVLHEALGAGVFELRLRDVPAPIFIDLCEVDDERCGG